MADSLHPLDVVLDDAHDLHREAVRLFASDGVICPDERRVLSLMDRLRAGALDYRARQRAAESYERNGATRHTQQMFRDAGLRLVKGGKEGSNVVPIGPHVEDLPPGAA